MSDGLNRTGGPFNEINPMSLPPSSEVAPLTTVLSKPSGRLGFGSGLLLSAGDRKTAVRLLETAFDNGIVYFDTARLYAEGLAEGLLGEAFSHRRDQVILVSKAGILPTSRALSRRLVNKALHVSRKVPPLRAILPEPKVAEPEFGVFDVPCLRMSVETSLRELRTDHLDALLLHECTPEDAADPEIRAFAEDLVREGKIRAYGVAPRTADALAIAQRGIAFGTILQVASSPWDDNVSRLAPGGDRLVVTHSVLGPRFRETVEALRHNQEAGDRWRAAFEIDPTDGADVARLFLRYALQQNLAGVVLFSTTRPARIRQNLRALERPLPPIQADLLPEMLRAL
ncbi:aldo/keto reductase [Hyphomicrobium sp. CS1GBMeth3]|uniref:aldo/keto reductase n=1 Tax=Hyphomicrobium sp. CS1GBMeth3 TaxID=1892845 RepID=UPI000931363B|nr:aldo/keto reductase [Hyphomicrobium sp. CS1GBMeth3]